MIRMLLLICSVYMFSVLNRLMSRTSFESRLVYKRFQFHSNSIQSFQGVASFVVHSRRGR